MRIKEATGAETTHLFAFDERDLVAQTLELVFEDSVHVEELLVLLPQIQTLHSLIATHRLASSMRRAGRSAGSLVLGGEQFVEVAQVLVVGERFRGGAGEEGRKRVRLEAASNRWTGGAPAWEKRFGPSLFMLQELKERMLTSWALWPTFVAAPVPVGVLCSRCSSFPEPLWRSWLRWTFEML